MRCERIAAGEDPGRTVAAMRSLVPSAESVSDAVAEIIARVAIGGDAAVLEYTRALDTMSAEPAGLRVDAIDLARATDELDPAVRVGLDQAIDNVRSVATMAPDRYRPRTAGL